MVICTIDSLVNFPLVMLFAGIITGMNFAVASPVLTADGVTDEPFSFLAVTLTNIGWNILYPI